MYTTCEIHVVSCVMCINRKQLTPSCRVTCDCMRRNSHQVGKMKPKELLRLPSEAFVVSNNLNALRSFAFFVVVLFRAENYISGLLNCPYPTISRLTFLAATHCSRP